MPGHFCNIDVTNPTWIPFGTLSLSSSAALHSLLVVSLHPLHTFAADNNPVGGSLFSTSHRRFAGNPDESRSGSGSLNRSRSSPSDISGGSKSTSSNDSARGRREKGCRGGGWRTAQTDEGAETAENVDTDESEGVEVEAEEGVVRLQLCPFLGRPQRPQL